jgi:hypothetical protein
LEIPENPLIVVIPPTYVKALLKLHDKLEGKGITWALSGNLGEALRTVHVKPDCIEIVTSQQNALKIHEAAAEFNSSEFTQTVTELPRKTSFQGHDYPLYTKSYHFEFSIDNVPVKVDGDLQFRVNDWDWGDIFEFEPDVVYIVNKKTSVVPLQVKYELYQSLGWIDKAEQIKQVFEIRQKLLHHGLR